MSHGVDYGAMETYRNYRLRDEQEKCLWHMKDWMVSGRQRNWSKEGKTGRPFILFEATILSSHIRHVWKSARFRDIFSSSLEMADETRPIRCIGHTSRAKVMTPFVRAQADICEVFGFAKPENCAPTYKSRQQPRRKRGRPAKSSGKNGFQ
ncbi:MAG: hypothetical protein LBP92_02425 [Deltaproteobacteria bacterium]|nr:hypothetical protein [Deltaproteobacteria bacterium]